MYTSCERIGSRVQFSSVIFKQSSKQVQPVFLLYSSLSSGQKDNATLSTAISSYSC